MVDCFGLFLQIAGKVEIKIFQRHISFFIGESFILLATVLAIYSVLQHKRILKTIRPIEVPSRYNLRAGMVLNSVIGLLGIVITVYLARGFI